MADALLVKCGQLRRGVELAGLYAGLAVVQGCDAVLKNCSRALSFVETVNNVCDQLPAPSRQEACTAVLGRYEFESERMATIGQERVDVC